MSAASLLQHASALHGAGRLPEAAALYRRVLSTDPRNARVHYLLAACLIGSAPDQALASVERAIALDPLAPDYHAVRGHALKALGRREEAVASYREAVRRKPSYAEMQYNLANALLLGDRAELEEATVCYRRALRLKPGLAGAYNNLGHALRLLQRPGEAVESFRLAQRANPLAPDVLANLGAALAEDGQHAAAVPVLTEAARLAPSAAIWLQLGRSLQTLRRWEDAAGAFAQAVRIAPDDIAAAAERAHTLVMAEQFAQAEALLQDAMRRAPDRPELLNNLAYLMMQSGRVREAVDVLEQALALEPFHPDARYGLSTALLKTGDYSVRAWELLDSRWEALRIARPRPGPQWNGDRLEGTLLLDSEQGAGDTIQFCRYAMLASERAQMALVVPVPLRRLMQSLQAPAVILLTPEDPVPEHEAHAPLWHMPSVFATSRATIPSAPGYLTADAEAVLRWRARLDELPGRHVGLVWNGNPDFVHAQWRDVPASALAPLARIPGISFISLQKPAPVGPVPEGLIARDWTDELHDFADTAALVSALDLVIGCDTGVMHLAGALGKPAWIMHYAHPDWRWYPPGSATPWYSTMRQFWQSRLGEWGGLIDEVCEALRTWRQ